MSTEPNSEKRSLLAQLIKFIQVDNEISAEEFGLLSRIAAQLKVSKFELSDMFKEQIKFHPPKQEFERIVQFHRFVLLMNIDGIINEEELYFIKNAAIKLGLNPKATNEVLVKMHNYPNKLIPTNILLQIFTQHFN
ncbi:MAG: hypothetical protein ACI9G9_000608 [Psychromonas sp.]|jgi:hypothetical protein